MLGFTGEGGEGMPFDQIPGEPTKLQLARAEAGMSQGAVIATMRRYAEQLRIKLPGDASLKTMLSRWENARAPRMTADNRRLLRMVYRKTDDELGVIPAEPDLQRQVVHASAPVTRETLEYFDILFNVHTGADNAMGPHHVIGIVDHQAKEITAALREAPIRLREELAFRGSRYQEFLGWLHQDAGHLDRAMVCTDRARDLALEVDAPDLTSYLLMRKSNIASDAGNHPLALRLADAALNGSDLLPPGVRGAALRQKANALAGLGEVARCREVIDEALTAVDRQDVAGSLAPYCTTSYVAMEASTCWLQLNQPERALDVLQRAGMEWPEAFRRDHGLSTARLARAYAALDDPTLACENAREALMAAQITRSARSLRELRLLCMQLQPWRREESVRYVTATVASLVGSAA